MSDVGRSPFFPLPKLQTLIHNDCFLSNDLRFSSRNLSLHNRYVFEAANKAMMTTRITTMVMLMVFSAKTNIEVELCCTRTEKCRVLYCAAF